MRFSQLHMQNFRGIRNLDIAFEPDMTVIIGRNGAGKTSVLDALASFMELILVSIKGMNTRTTHSSISLEDVRFETKSLSLQVQLQIEDEGSKSIQQHELKIEFDGGPALPIRLMRDVFQKLPKEIGPTLNYIYYRQNRVFATESTTDRNDPERVFDPDFIRYDFLDKELREIGDLQTWWDRRDAQEARMVRDKNPGYRDPQLEAIRHLVRKIDCFKDITYSSTESRQGLYLIKNNDTPVHVSRLSSGERSYIVLLADLARRLQVFAPKTPIEDISAIVLIDEVELNLHPAWQSEIGPTLMNVFNACQFVLTTHSPQVLSEVENRRVRILEEMPTGETEIRVPLSTKGRTSNYLLDGVFGTPERYPPVEQLIESFNRAVDRVDVAAAEATFKVVEEEIGDDASTLLVLRKRLRNLRINT